MFLPLTSRLDARTRDLVEVSIIETERSRWQNACGRKKKYSDYGAALATARRMTATLGITYEVYPCDFDNRHFHVGRSQRAPRQQAGPETVL